MSTSAPIGTTGSTAATATASAHPEPIAALDPLTTSSVTSSINTSEMLEKAKAAAVSAGAAISSAAHQAGAAISQTVHDIDAKYHVGDKVSEATAHVTAAMKHGYSAGHAAEPAATASLAGVFLGIGNPLLDISADVPQSFLDQYGVKVNDAILAEPKHLPIYDDLKQNFKVAYTAGGATQNTVRIAQWLLPAHSTSYIGCVGADENAAILKNAAEADGVATHYLTTSEHPTGRCAVLVFNKDRSLVTDLAAANHYQLSHLQTAPIDAVVQKARYIYSAGFFLTVSPPSLMHLAHHVQQTGKKLLGNISAPFIAQFFSEPLMAAMPYYDYLFGNESEAEALGTKLALSDISIPAIARHLSGLPKVTAGDRVVVITQGSKATVVSVGGREVESYEVELLDRDSIVDLNGAGDAFVGGFVSQLVQGKPMEQCVQAGHYAARTIIQVSGIVLKGKADKFVYA